MKKYVIVQDNKIVKVIATANIENVTLPVGQRVCALPNGRPCKVGDKYRTMWEKVKDFFGGL